MTINYCGKRLAKMVLDIIAAAVLIAAGVLMILFAIDSDASDPKLLGALFLGAVLIFGGGWIILSKLTLGLIIRKVGGLLLTAAGLFLVIGFPDILEYQPEGFSKTGILVGIILFIIGAWLLLF